MATVSVLSDAYVDHLLPVLHPAPDVCRTCGTGLVAAPLCLQCRRARALLSHPADAVASIALAVKGDRLARDLAAYKLPAHPQLRAQLAAVLWRWLRHHEPCLARAAGAGREFQVVTAVPSLRGRGPHPLDDLVGRLVLPTRTRFASLLTSGAEPGFPYSDRRFACSLLPAGASVLVVDDTWTTGGHAQSAASALHLAGAGAVAVLTLGRHFHPSPPERYAAAARSYLTRVRRQGWSWEECALCRPFVRLP